MKDGGTERRVSFTESEPEQPPSPRSNSPEAGSLPRSSPILDGPPAQLAAGSIVDGEGARSNAPEEPTTEESHSVGSSKQYRLSRRFRDPVVESEYLDWHFSVWGRRTAIFVALFALLVLANLCIVLAGTSTRRRALAVDDSLYAWGSLVIANVAGVLFATIALFLFSRSSYYNPLSHQVSTALFLVMAFAIDTSPRIAYAVSDALEPVDGGLCNTTFMRPAELTSLAAGDAASFAYAQCLVLGAVTVLAGLHAVCKTTPPISCTGAHVPGSPRLWATLGLSLPVTCWAPPRAIPPRREGVARICTVKKCKKT